MRLVGALVLAGSAACYTYVPVNEGTIAPKEEVRVRISEDAAARLAKDLGAFSTELDGRFTREPHDSISIGVAINREYRGAVVGSTTQLLYLGRSEVLDVRKRQFSRSRTTLLGVGAVVGFGALAAGIKQLVDPNGPSDDQPSLPPPAPQRGRVTFRISLPLGVR